MASSSTQPLATAAGFLGSIAINTHAGFGWDGYNNVGLMKQTLSYLGVTTLRDGLSELPQAQPVLSALADAGYKFDLVTSSALPGTGTAGLANYVKALTAFVAANPTSVIALEGLNEANIQQFIYNGSSTMGAAAQFQAALYTAVKANAALKDIPVYNLTLGYDHAADHAALGDLTKYSDYANSHAYVSTNTNILSSFDVSLGLAKKVSSGDPTVITETGYTTLEKTADLGTNQSAQAKLILNTLVTAFKGGVAKTYLYELLDRGNDPQNLDKEAHFGLFDVNGNPKLAATALHNLTTILNDNGTGTATPTKALGYTLTNLQSSGDSMVLAKSNGAYDLVVWNAPKVWNDITDKEIVTAKQNVKLHFDTVQKTVVVYDPLGGTTPIATYTNVQDIVLPISDHPLIVEIGGTGLMGKPAVVTPAVVSGTAQSIVAQIDMLKLSTTLEKITLVDGHVLPVATAETMKYMIANDQAVLSKIVGGYQFAITQTAPTWKKVEVFDSTGKLFSTKEAAVSNGVVTTEQTKFADGKIDTVNYANGVKSNEVIVNANGSREIFVYNIKGQDYVTEHVTYAKSGALTSYERLHADNTLAFAEIRDGNHKTVSWYDAKGVITRQADYPTNGTVVTTWYKDGYKTQVNITYPDNRQENFYFDKPAVIVPVAPVAPVVPAVQLQKEVTGTAQSILDQLSSLKQSTALEKITLVGTNVIPVPSSVAMKSMIDNDQAVLSKIVGGYQFSVTQTASTSQKIELFSSAGKLISTKDITLANGVVTVEQTKYADGKIDTVNYANGVKTDAVVVQANGVKDTYIFNIKGQDFVTEHVTYAKTGAMTNYERLRADDTLVFTETRSGNDKTVSWYDAKGVLSKQAEYPADGSVTTTWLANGAKTHVNVTHADKTQDNTLYGIQNQTYVTEIQKIDATGQFVDVQRLHSDGTLDYHWSLASNGTKTMTHYDSAGTKVSDVLQHANGSSDIFKFVIAGQPGVTQHEKFDTSKTLVLLDVTKADGTHQVTALSTGVTMTGGDGNDTVKMFGKDTFVFSHGKDVVSNFHADDTAANHDQLQISKSLAASFAALNLSQVGADTLVTINSHDSILLKGVALSHVTAGDFVFV